MARVGAGLWWGALLVLVAGIAGAVFIIDAAGWFGPHAAFRRGLVRRGRVVVVADGAPLADLSGTRFVAVDGLPRVRAALSAEAGPALASALRAADLDAVLIDPTRLPSWVAPDSVAARLAEHASIEGLVGRYLAADAALYAPDPLSMIPAPQREALALVARRILSGERPPRVQSFPEPLRAVAHVEVMIMLRNGPRPRLWRSARGSSIARAFLTAVRVAGQRWDERAQAMGAPLSEALPGLVVEVSLLQDDGELGTRSPAFIDRVFHTGHGVAYDRKGAWRYMLPATTAEQGRPSQAFAQLLADNGLPPDAIYRDEIRPYRLRVRSLAVSEAPRSEPDPLGPIEHPDEVLLDAP